MLNWVKDWGALVTVVLAAVTGLLWIGGMRSDVATLQRDVGQLQDRLKEVEEPRPKTAKGELCGKLIDGLVDASKDSISGESRQKPLLDAAGKMDCFEGVPAAATVSEEEYNAMMNATANSDGAGR